MSRKNVSSGTEWEPRIGYSRAVTVGHHVHVSGTTATDETGELIGEDDAYAQTVQTIKNIQWALHEADADLGDVVRTCIYLTDVDSWEEVGRAHAEFFGDVRPASTMVEVSQLVDPRMLVEIEATAYREN